MIRLDYGVLPPSTPTATRHSSSVSRARRSITRLAARRRSEPPRASRDAPAPAPAPAPGAPSGPSPPEAPSGARRRRRRRRELGRRLGGFARLPPRARVRERHRAALEPQREARVGLGRVGDEEKGGRRRRRRCLFKRANARVERERVRRLRERIRERVAEPQRPRRSAQKPREPTGAERALVRTRRARENGQRGGARAVVGAIF